MINYQVFSIIAYLATSCDLSLSSKPYNVQALHRRAEVTFASVFYLFKYTKCRQLVAHSCLHSNLSAFDLWLSAVAQFLSSLK